ncbi:PAS domain S-box protein [Haladaptatus sp. GCM10026878]|uniref:PAS domain S-box protein n=1 Tax=Haladaptatus sp. GCM10026878 TaxID=3252660 RepID=UPI0036F3DD86
METPEKRPPTTLRDTLRVFEKVDTKYAPLTAQEVADGLGTTHKIAREHLARLTEQGTLGSKRVGDTRVWWLLADRTHREADLRRERELTDQLLKTAPVAISVKNAAGETIVANRRAQDLLGLSEREILDKPEDVDEWDIFDATGEPLDPEDTPAARVYQTGNPVFNEEVAIRRPSGEQMWFSVNAAPIFDDDGTLDRVVSAGEDITELKKRERQLEQRKSDLETELSEILGRISDGFYALDNQWCFIHVNSRAEEILQHTATDLLGTQIWTAFPDAEDSLFWEQVHEAMDSQEPVSFEVHEAHEDRWLEVNAYPSKTGLSVYLKDISQRVHREHQLERYEKIFETIQDGVYSVDNDNRFTMVNDAYLEMVEYPREELIGAHSSTVVETETTETAQEIQQSLESDEVESSKLEADLYTSSGRTIRAEATFALLPGDGDGYERVGVVRDVSDRVARERALTARARQQKAVSELGQLALENSDLDDLFKQASQRVAAVLENDYCKVLELDATAEHLLLRQGVGWRDGIVGTATVSSVEAESQASYTLLSEGPVIVTDLENDTRLSGPELLTSHGITSGISTIIGSLEAPWGILGTHATEKKLFTDEDISFIQSVANILAEAIERQRYEDELEALVEALGESNERLEQFAYIASHDLQEPLRMISNYLQLIESRYRDELDDDARDFIDFAVDGAERMREMVNGLLKYSRVDTETEPFEPTDIEAVVERVLANLQLPIEQHAIEVAVEPLPTVYGDRKQFEQLFQNLVSNAIKYRSDTSPQIEIGVTERETDWLFAISDNGIGIDTDHHERIFEVFRRLHSHEEYAGTGIGLALCRKIVERHSGRIWVESAPNEGSTFYVTIPRTEVSNE